MKIKHLALAAVILVAGCSKSPDDTVHAFYKAVEAGDQDAAIQLLHPTAIALLGDKKLHAGLRMQEQQFKACGGVSNVALNVASHSDSRQQGTATVTFKGQCKPITERFALEKAGGKWLIAP